MRRLAPLLLAGCAALPQPTPSVYLGHDCEGREVNVRFSEYVTPTPTLDCVRVAVALGMDPASAFVWGLGMPISCAFTSPRGNAVVLPPWASDDMRYHEYEHLVGKWHPPLVPFYVGNGC